MLEAQKYPELMDMDTYTLPKIGYIAFYYNIDGTNTVIKDKMPIAAGFLRRVEGDVIAHIDGLTSNPYIGGILRHNALSQILNRLTDDAKELELKGLIAFCLDPSMIKRAESIGFKIINQTTLIKSL